MIENERQNPGEKTHGLNYPPWGADVMLHYALGATATSPTTGVKLMILQFHFGRFLQAILFGNKRSLALRPSHLRKKPPCINIRINQPILRSLPTFDVLLS